LIEKTAVSRSWIPVGTFPAEQGTFFFALETSTYFFLTAPGIHSGTSEAKIRQCVCGLMARGRVADVCVGFEPRSAKAGRRSERSMTWCGRQISLALKLLRSVL